MSMFSIGLSGLNAAQNALNTSSNNKFVDTCIVKQFLQFLRIHTNMY